MTATQPQGADKKGGEKFWLMIPMAFALVLLMVYGIPFLMWLLDKEEAWLKIH